MAAATGRKATDLKARILAQPRSFTLGQALRLLGFMHATTHDERFSFILKNTYIRPWLSLAFPPSELLEVEEQEDPQRFLLTASNFGLYSTLGPLPTLYTEELLEEARSDESISRDFLDILNNHLFHLRHMAWHHNRLERRTIEDNSRDAAHIQFCLMGQGAPPLRESGPPRALLTELLARRVRSAAQLARYLAYVLERNDVGIEQCVERRVPIPADQRCRPGLGCATLGEDAVLGSVVRDSVGKFRIHLNSVAPDEMQHFLPGSEGYTALAGHLRAFLDSPLEYEIKLHPAGEKPQPTQLGVSCAIGFYLGSPENCPSVSVFRQSPSQWDQTPRRTYV